MRTEAFRLLPGTDLKRELKRLAKENDFQAGVVLTCVGSLTKASLRMAGATPNKKDIASFDEELEIVSMVGTLCSDGIHIHVALSRNDGQCVGGHLADGCIVKTTAEIVIAELPNVTFRRMNDVGTGFRELSVYRR